MSDDLTSGRLAAASLAERTGVGSHRAVVVLGSGWDIAAECMGRLVAELPVTDLPGFRATVAPGHRGVVRSYDLDGDPVLVFLGRTHLYEGHGPGPVAHPVRVAAAAGAQLAVLTNASGSLRPDWAPGTGAVLTDHVNWTGVSPLTGPRFVDLTDAWSPGLRAAALDADPTLVPAVYAQMTGPAIQTGAETRMLRTVGADLVGMSTVMEAIAARAAGLELLGLSAVTTVEDSGVELDAEDVVAVATRTASRLGPVVRTVLRHWLARTPERTPS
ncbi:MAG: purine-nucleoside phosphorylase [Spirochaetaceae bacterium]|nr:purine-nucleoside phosphorylase [Spirochaetaceae bacterium]